jgi:glycosyltransferase involved in cell wall biosynthesis
MKDTGSKGPANSCGLSPAFEFAFIGGPVPDEERFWNASFSRAGNLATFCMVRVLVDEGLSPTLVVSLPPMPAWPRSRKLWSPPATVAIEAGAVVELLGFVNITPVKELMMGVSTFLRILRWGSIGGRAVRRVVLSYNLTVPPGIFTYWACRLVQIPYVAIVFDVNTPGETVPDRAWFRLDYAIQRWLLPRLSGRIVISESIACDFAPGKPFLVVEGGLSDGSIEALRRVGEERDRVRSEEFVVGFAGFLSRANGICELLGAMHVLRDVRVRLVLAGDGPLREAVSKAAAADTRITYLGQLQHREVIALYGRCCLLANVRLTKGLNTRYLFPSKVLEYCGSGVPVLTTRVGSSFARLESLVFVLEDETAEGVAEMIRTAVSMGKEERAAKGRSAQRFVFAEMSWRAQGRRIREYLERCVLGTGGQSN